MELGIREEELKKKTKGRGGEGIEGYTLDHQSVSAGCPYKEQPKTCTCAPKLFSFLEILFFHGAPTYFKERGRPQTTHLSGFCFPIWNRISRRQPETTTISLPILLSLNLFAIEWISTSRVTQDLSLFHGLVTPRHLLPPAVINRGHASDPTEWI